MSPVRLVPYGNGSGVDLGVKDEKPAGRIVDVRGRETARVSRDRPEPKGLNGWTANGFAHRSTRDKKVSGTLERVKQTDARRREWLMARLKQAVLQVPVVPS